LCNNPVVVIDHIEKLIRIGLFHQNHPFL
jgi:hypothetical protein